MTDRLHLSGGFRDRIAPAPQPDEAAAIVAALALWSEAPEADEAPLPPSRWRMAARDYANRAW